jgi:predicted dehydrogenase
MISKNTWLIGTGSMAIEYAKVLKALGYSYTAIGRGKYNCDKFFNETGTRPEKGGLDKYLSHNPLPADAAIVAVGIESLSEITKEILKYNIKYILIEKPGVGYADEIYDLCDLVKQKNAIALLAYNRRFYASVQKAKELIKDDGGVSSFQFEFTEWSHKIRELEKHPAEHRNWFLGNSTHVIDTAFYLGGTPVEICCYVKGGMDWHPTSSIYAGAGTSNTGALFSYNANWEAPGRWVLEMLTKKHRFIFKPLEKLQMQDIGSVDIYAVDIDDKLDIDFKPGLYLQTKAFIEGNYNNFCEIHSQKQMIENIYSKMSGYNLKK